MTSKTTNKFSPEVRERAVPMVLEHERDHPSRWAAIVSIAEKIGCTGQTLNEWVKKAEVDAGRRAGVPMEMGEKLKALERENRELRQANKTSHQIEAHGEVILEAVRSQPDITLKELRALLAGRGVSVAVSTLRRFFDRRGVTLKKRPGMPRSRTVPIS